MASIVEVDPRLQISDIADYRFQQSLAYNNAYANPTTSNASYYQPLPDEGRFGTRASDSSIKEGTTRLDNSIRLYQSVPVHQISQEVEFSHPTGTTEPSLNGSEIKDPTVYTPPHLLAPMKANPPSLKEWRNKLFNIDEPLFLTTEEYLTYFPHVDNVYSHRSTQKYKRRPFVSHYWDCRLKGRPTGTPLNKRTAPDVHSAGTKKRKRKTRERDLCDVKIKVTEYFGIDELEALRKLGLGPDPNTELHHDNDPNELALMSKGQVQQSDAVDTNFGVLGPANSYPRNHPGHNGRKWYMVQRVHGNERDGEELEDRDLDHKHTIEESDRIKKNSVQRWLLSKEKERKKVARETINRTAESGDEDSDTNSKTSPSGPPSRFHASGSALQTLCSHFTPTTNQLIFYGSSFCPFAQRIWIALEYIGLPYQYVELTEHHWMPNPGNSMTTRRLAISGLNDINPDGNVPCLKHNNFAVWESIVMLEYLEDLNMGQSLFPLGGAQLKAHSRLWVDFINRRILPVFYALILLPDHQENDAVESTEVLQHLAHRHARQEPGPGGPGLMNDERYILQTHLPPHSIISSRAQYDTPMSQSPALDHTVQESVKHSSKSQNLINTLHTTITTLVNASHRTGPYFLGPTLSYVDIVFAPWIIRLSRVLSYYRGFPQPEVGTRWQAWVDAVEKDDVVKRTVSEEQNYRDVYGAMNSDVWEFDTKGRVDYTKARDGGTHFPEMAYARRVADPDAWDLGPSIQYAF